MSRTSKKKKEKERVKANDRFGVTKNSNERFIVWDNKLNISFEHGRKEFDSAKKAKKLAQLCNSKWF